MSAVLLSIMLFLVAGHVLFMDIILLLILHDQTTGCVCILLWLSNQIVYTSVHVMLFSYMVLSQARPRSKKYLGGETRPSPTTGKCHGRCLLPSTAARCRRG